ncbi:hypothetical protein HDV05_002503 [Chytridiales sp. JEL 0842]|nr:hypothetical protein HDV05_002503 [Chytridiales sp. JEL 0842]
MQIKNILLALLGAAVFVASSPIPADTNSVQLDIRREGGGRGGGGRGGGGNTGPGSIEDRGPGGTPPRTPIPPTIPSRPGWRREEEVALEARREGGGRGNGGRGGGGKTGPGSNDNRGPGGTTPKTPIPPRIPSRPGW